LILVFYQKKKLMIVADGIQTSSYQILGGRKQMEKSYKMFPSHYTATTHLEINLRNGINTSLITLHSPAYHLKFPISKPIAIFFAHQTSLELWN
jgi:hypothetical protein